MNGTGHIELQPTEGSAYCICDLADKLSAIHIRPEIEGSEDLNKVLETAEIDMWTDAVNVLGVKVQGP